MSPSKTTLIFRLLKQAEIAHATGASVRTVRRWAQGSEPQARFAPRLDDLATVLAEVSESFTEVGVGQWMRARNRLLDGKRPLDLLAAGEFDKVYGAAVAFNEGVYV